MPAKGYFYSRNNIITKDLHQRFIEENDVEIDFKTFQKVILESNQVIFNIIADEPEGFKLPEGMGYLVVTRYRTTKKPIDWVNSKKYKRAVYLPNLHSFGYISHIMWCKFAIARFKYNEIYKFEPCRFLSRKVAANTKAGLTYFSWQNSDFWNTSKLDRLYNKTYKNKEE